MTSSDVQALMKEAERLSADDDFSGALSSYEQALAIDPENVTAMEGQATLLARTGEIDRALSCYDRLIAFAPDDPKAIKSKADLLLASGRYQEAVDYLDGFRARKDGSLLQRLGDAYRGLGKEAEAIEAYNAALESEPNRPTALVSKGDALLDAGRIDDAIGAFEDAMGLEPDGFNAIDWKIRGDRFFTSGDFATARRLYERAIEVEPGASTWRQLGLADQREGRLEEALEAYQAGLKLTPDDPDLQNDVAVTLIEQGRLMDAHARLERLTETHPDYTYGWLNRGYTDMQLGRLEEAGTWYARAVELDPSSADAWVSLGRVQVMQGDPDLLPESLRNSERAIDLDNGSYWAWNNAGYALRLMGRHDEALERLDRAIALDDDEPTAWVNKIDVFTDTGRIDEAEACLEELGKRTGRSPVFLTLKANFMSDWLGDDRGALELITESHQMDPTDEATAANTAEIYLKLGEFESCRGHASDLLRSESISESIRCGLLFCVYASFVLEGNEGEDREAAFHDFITRFRTAFVGDHSRRFEWNYQGLRRMIVNTVDHDETRFLLLSAIDVQANTIDAERMSYFSPAPIIRIEKAKV